MTVRWHSFVSTAVLAAGCACGTLAAPTEAGHAATGAGPRLRASVTVFTNYYVVTGSTPTEVSASKNRARPQKAGPTFDALTEWDVVWSFRYTGYDGEFRLAACEIKTKAVVTLPRWIPPAGADPWWVERWTQYVKCLALHELGHVTLARQATAEIQRQVATLRTYPSSRELTAAAERTIRLVMDQFRQKEREYDEQTRHGASQGATLRW